MTTTPRVHGWLSLALLSLAGLMAMVFWGPRKSLPTIPRPPEDANVLRVAYPQYLLPDPSRRSFPIAPQNQFILSLWEPLVECDPATGQPQPAAAQSWKWSADRKVLTLKLRPDARWSNGDSVTARDFVRGWTRLLHQRQEWAETLFPLKNAEAYHRGRVKDPEAVGMHALDDLTLRLELSQIRSTLVAELADPLLSPLHEGTDEVLDRYTYFADPTQLVTNGPFQLLRASYDGYRLKACDYYHDRAAVRLAGVQFVKSDSLALSPLLLAAGVVDLLVPTAFGEARDMPTNRQVKLDSELVCGVTSIDFNVRRGPLRDLRVRLALALALDRSGPINRYDPGHMVPAWSWVPSIPGRDGLTLLKEDAAEARRLLAEAGYPGGEGFPVLAMTLPLNKRSDPFPAAVAERWFQALGIRTHIIYEVRAVQENRLQADDYDVLYGTLIATVPDAGDLLGAFRSSSAVMPGNAEETAAGLLLGQADSLSGRERSVALEKAERLAMAAVSMVPLMFERSQAMMATEVQGWTKDPLARQNYKRLWLDIPQMETKSEPKS